MKADNRNLGIDAARLFAMLLVVLWHYVVFGGIMEGATVNARPTVYCVGMWMASLSVCCVDFHDSVQGVLALLESGIYRAEDKISVQRVENRDGWFDARGEEKKLSRGVAFSNLLKVNGGDVVLPVAIVGRDRRIMKTRVQKEVSDSISLYKGKTEVVYRILKERGLISESWRSFANRIGNNYLESCWRYYRLSSKMSGLRNNGVSAYD